MCFPLSVASTFLKTDVKHFASKFSFFSPPNDPHKNIFHNFCSLLSLRCSFASLFVRSRPPSKNACGSSPVLILPPRPRLHKRLHASHLQFSQFRVLFAVFFVPVILHTHVFLFFLVLCYKFASRRCHCFCHLFSKSVACSRCRAPTSRRLCIAYFFVHPATVCPVKN